MARSQRPLISGRREIDDGTSLLFGDSLGRIDAVDPRAETDVHQYEIGMQFRGLYDRVLPGSRAAGGLIAEPLDRVLDAEVTIFSSSTIKIRYAAQPAG